MKTTSGNIKLYRDNSDRNAGLRIANTVKIPANSEVFVEGYLESSKNTLRKGLLLTRSLVHSHKDRTGFSILNLQDKSIKLKQDSVIGVVQPVDDVQMIKPLENPKAEFARLREANLKLKFNKFVLFQNIR